MVTSSMALAPHDASADEDTSRVDEEFFTLIYSDEELLRGEFEELVSTAWSRRPPPTATPSVGEEYAPDNRRTPGWASAGRTEWAGLVRLPRSRGPRTRGPPNGIAGPLLPSRKEDDHHPQNRHNLP
jgi:hypothetical protein